MIVLGLTGSIGMGKSTTAQLFEAEGARVFDADAEVARLYEPGGQAFSLIAEAFPGCASEATGVDRVKLSAALQADPAGFETLNGLIHPLVGQVRQAFFDAAARDGIGVVVLDVPLLFETGGEARVDHVVVVSAPADVQRTRVLARDGMSEAKFEAILARQMPDSEKLTRADFVIDTSSGIDHARDQVRAVLNQIQV